MLTWVGGLFDYRSVIGSLYFITEERRRATGVVLVVIVGELAEGVIGLAEEVHRQTGSGPLEFESRSAVTGYSNI
jgi:hypothetical protein